MRSKLFLRTTLFFMLLLAFSTVQAAETQIDIDTDITPATITPTPKVNEPALTGSINLNQSTATPTMTSQLVATKTSAANPLPDGEIIEAPQPGQGVLQMKAVYKAGIDYYSKHDYSQAIRYLKESLKVHDPYTPHYYFAEANAMLGVIYQFHIIDRDLAYHYYLEALRIDPSTKTARKHLKEVKPKN